MAIELSNLTFTEQDDVVPASGVEEILNTGIANTLAGNDRITGTKDVTIDTSSPYGIYNYLGTLNTADGDDIITGTITGTKNTPDFSCGILNLAGTINTGNGNDIITGIGTLGIYIGGATLDTGDGNDIITGIGSNGGRGVYLNFGSINTGDGDDTITGSGASSSAGIDVNSLGSLDTGKGNDIITGTSGSGYGIVNFLIINSGEGNDKITGTSLGSFGILNVGTMNTGDGNDEITTGTGTNNGWGIYNGSDSTINTGDGDDTITSNAIIYNEGIINTGNGDDSIIVEGGFDPFTGNTYGIKNNGGAINMGDGNDSIIANEGFESAPNSSGAWFLGEGDDYIKGYGSGDFYGGNGNDTLELTPGTYTVGIWGEAGESPIFTKGDQLMITSEFEKLKAGSTIYDFTSLTAGQIIIVA
jgi:hypothetical protein